MARKEKEVTCPAQMESMAVEDHTHTCTGKHDAFLYHFCGECGRWWWKRPEEEK